MDTDVMNPMMFDLTAMKKKYENGEHVPAGFTFEEVKKWRCLYTTYFDANLSIKEGRRVATDKCAEKPNVHMLANCCDALGLKYVMEPLKKHPRDYFNNGRLKVQIVDDAGRPTHKDIGTSKRKLYQAVADQMPEAIVKYTDALEE